MAAWIGTNHLVRLLEGWGVGEGALPVRLAGTLRNLIRSGALPAGARLPSERALAAALYVGRNTVSAAFDTLRGEAVFTSRRGDGTYVSAARRFALARGDDRLHSFLSGPYPADTAIDLQSAAVPGLDMVAEEADRIRGDGIRPLLDSHGYLPAGLDALRAEVAAMYSRLGLPTTEEQILITSGAQQALRLAVASILDPGATVLIEEPSFRGAIEVLRGAGAHLIPVPSGSDGVDVPALNRALQAHRPALVILQSTVHNPTGSVLEDDARKAIATLAETYGVPVIDDISPADTLVDRAQPVPMAAYGSPVITIGSASKAFWGGLRVGWLRADPDTVQTLASLKGGEDLGTSLLAQSVVAGLLPRIEEARAARAAWLKPARNTLLTALSELLPDWEVQVPAGGASVWIRLPGDSAQSFAQRAERAGVRLLPGPTFSCVDGLDDHLRIGFARPLEEVLAGVRRLARVWC
ncbi:PLP-dependent aminotransferase family protein [Phytohabitans flavus]|uniref:GntR family transcriptional regulator n=1 Tax=Phytohabitans flavus TaxID=1076124 RepID=A0A6F8XN61_9ACTN|nr:PLP-dependent aminotransferase family protein [Phytohabitans flavus]BCB75265.1 GntR family transcriptional regulator [Phytohabitans flavus]